MRHEAASADPAFASTVDADIVAPSTIARSAKSQRLLSIDVLRGLTVAFMIIVNDQAGPAPFSQLSHAKWNGFTLTDLVFPTFLFVVGLTTVLSISARRARGATRQELLSHSLRRALVLIAFGFVVNNFPWFHLATVRYYGVLPRIAICYFVVAAIQLFFPDWRGKVAIASFCLIAYWILLRFVPVPGFGVPTQTVPMNDPTGNLTAWLDRQIFSPQHLYEKVRDPEGLLSTVPALATTLFGVLAGQWLRGSATTARKVAVLASCGLLMQVAGLLWNPWFPINKKLWTSSYTLFAGGCSLLLLAAAIAVVDLWRVGRRQEESNDPASPRHPTLYRPVLVLGTNAILAYMVSELADPVMRNVHLASGKTLKATVVNWFATTIPSPPWSSLMYSLAYLFGCWLLVWPFYRKRIFLRI